MEGSRIHRIETPEKIVFAYEIATPGVRMGAWLIDFLIQAAGGGLLVLVAALFGAATGLAGTESGGALFAAFAFLVFFFMQWVYFSAFEIATRGQSPGKKAMKIRVIKSDGESLDASSIIVRNLLRAVDSLPLFNILGGLVCSVDRKGRRLGDLAAETLVVHCLAFDLKLPRSETLLSGAPDPSISVAAPRASRRLSEDELLVLRSFLAGAGSLPQGKRDELARKLAEKVARNLGDGETGRGPAFDPFRYLEEAYRGHADPER